MILLWYKVLFGGVLIELSKFLFLKADTTLKLWNKTTFPKRVSPRLGSLELQHILVIGTLRLLVYEKQVFPTKLFQNRVTGRRQWILGHRLLVFSDTIDIYNACPMHVMNLSSKEQRSAWMNYLQFILKQFSAILHQSTFQWTTVLQISVCLFSHFSIRPCPFHL